MILKQLRLSKHLSQEQLAHMSGLNVRTIQRIESGHNASLESRKCLAASLDVDVNMLDQEYFMIDKNSDNWDNLPLIVKGWFVLNFLQLRPRRKSAVNIEILAHSSGFLFCCIGWFSQAALAGGLIMLLSGYLFQLLKWQGDKYGIWYESDRQ